MQKAANIDKLSILGIRSFDNTRSETIQFYSPLTLIVGYNGSGKTRFGKTIIECLKYATTGDQPPNSKGGAFIHDPQLCGEKEVLAQVKLSFKSTSGAKMVATRSLQLTVKKTVRSLKTLEGQLLMVKDGERTAISSRVAELDQIMPQYLGVSKAVLDNVVFCHQDESLWPLSEPSVLKKKFDEIFEALKYTKAIDNIKVLKKKQTEELAKLKIIEQHEKENKDKGERAEKRANLLTEEIEELRVQSQKLDVQIKEAQQKANEAWDNASQFERIITQLEGKRMEAKVKEESIQDLKLDIQMMNESDDQLSSMLEQFEQRAASFATEVQSKRKTYQTVDQGLAEKRDELRSKEREHGKYQAEKDEHERQIQKRQASVKDIARRHNIRGFDQELNDARIREFVERVAKMARDQNATLERARQETNKEISEAQVALARLNEQKSALNHTKENAKSQIAASDRKIASHDVNLNSIAVDEGARANLESTVQAIRKTLQDIKAKSESADWDAQIRDTESKLRALDDRKEELDAEVVQATKYASETAQVDHLHRTVKDSRTSLDTMKGAHGDKLTKLIGPQWQETDVESAYQSVVDAKNADIKDAQAQSEGLNRELGQLNYKISSYRNDIKKKSDQAKLYEKEIRDATGEDDLAQYPAVVELAEKNVNTSKRDLEMSKWYIDCRKTFEEHDACRLCKRTFNRQKERSDFLEVLKKFTEGVDAAEMAEELEQFETDLRALRNVAPSYDIWQSLTQKDIPAAERELHQLETEQNNILRQLDEADLRVKDVNAAKRELDTVAKNVQQIAKYHNDITKLSDQIAALSAKPTASGMSRGLEAISEEQKKVNEQYRTTRKTLNELQAERDRSKTQISNMEIEVRDTNEKLKEAVGQLKERDSINAQREELLHSVREQRETIAKMDEQLQQLAPQISQSQVRYDDVQRRADEKQKELQEEASKINNSANQLKNFESDIQAYIDRNGPQQLARAEREIDNIREAEVEMATQQRDLSKEINALMQQEQSHAATKRTIERNIKYRKDVTALDVIRNEITNLEGHNAEADRERHMQEANRWQLQRNKLAGEQASLTGQMKSKDDQLTGLLDDWNTDYKDAAFKYREANIRVQATKAAVEDLGRYGGALDKAIMKYHGLKMDEINSVIEELWRKTYQGTDVDTILIRSDNENVKGNKSYNYRVCMVKSDAEMDMRGRCSAGQRVLASIIIRLALAECFGVACGLIALDEPTTNLDRDNIKALAEALHGIIKARQQQANFQLIVITHDEEFLRYMQCRDFADYYYRVSRNEKQKSEINRQSLAEVM